MYSRPSSWACSINGAFVVVRPLPGTCSARTPAMGSPLLLLVPPGRDPGPFGLDLDGMRRSHFERRYLDLLVGQHGALRIEELEHDSNRRCRNRFALQVLRLATRGAAGDR